MRIYIKYKFGICYFWFMEYVKVLLGNWLELGRILLTLIINGGDLEERGG
jgi:hypothetical protein